jgi:TLC domain
VTVVGLDVSLTIASSLFLGCVRFFAEYVIMIPIFHWPRNSMDTKLSAASVTSITHSVVLVSTLYVLLTNAKPSYNPSGRMADEEAGPWWNDTVGAILQFCTGYMIYDAVLNIIWIKLAVPGSGGISSEDLLFLGHHIVTTLYMSSTRWIQAGHQSAMMCMFLGELTNPLHNSYYIGQFAQKHDCCNGKVSQQMFTTIEFSFGLFYSLMRGIIAPVVFIHMTYNLITIGLFKVKEIPNWLIPLWIILIWGVEIGSIPWILECLSFVSKNMDSELATKLGISSSISVTEL